MIANAACICRFSSEDTVGLSIGASANSVAVTVAEQGVSVYTTEQQEKIVTWLIGSAAKRFVVPAVYSSASQRYHTVTKVEQHSGSEQQLWSWPADLSTPLLEDGCSRVELPKPVVAVVPLPLASGQVASSALPTLARKENGNQAEATAGALLVHADASVQLDSHYLAFDSESQASSIASATPVAIAADQRQLAVLYRDHEQSLQLILHTVQADDTLDSRGPAAILPSTPTAKLSATCLRNQQFTALWSDGTLQTWQLTPGSSAHLHMAVQATQQLTKLMLAASQLVNGKVRHRQGQTAGLLDPLRSGSLASAVAVHDSMVGVLAWSALQNGETGGQRLQFTVRDLHYASVPLDAELHIAASPSAPAVQALLLDASGGQQQLAVLVGSRVLIAPLQVQPVTLASLVASAKDSPADVSASAAPPQYDSAQWLSALEQAAAEPRIAVPVTPMEIEEPSTSASAWQQLVDGVSSLRHSSLTHKAAARVVSSILAQQQQPPAELLCQAALALAQQGQYKALEQLLQPQVLPLLGQCHGLVPVLAQEEKHQLLQHLLPHGRDLPAADLLALLDVLLQSRVTAGIKEARRKHRQHLRQQAELLLKSAAAGSVQPLVAAAAAHAVDAFTAEEICLHAVVAMRLDPTVMLAVLQALLPEQVLLLARYLLKWLEFHEPCSGGLAAAQNVPGAVVFPSLQSVLQWLSVAVNAHLVALALLPGAREVVTAIQESIQQQVESGRGLAKLLGVVQHLSQRATLPSSTVDATSLYSIEVLDLRIKEQ